MNRELKSAILILIVSTAAMVWGVNYRNNHAMNGVELMPSDGPLLYMLAGWVLRLGVFSFLTGVGFLVAGIVKNPDEKPPKC